jgi:maleylacetate reductase
MESAMQAPADFIFQAKPTRVVFGPGSLQQLEHELAQLGGQRAMVLCTPGQRALGEAIMQRLGERAVVLCDFATMHVPVEIVARARQQALRHAVDCTVAIGGGSTIGLAKALALESGLPIIAIATTYSGSEATAVYGITEAGLKRTGTDLRVLPKVVIYDPALTLALPIALSVTSGINAIAHAAEGLYAKDANPITSLMAEEGIRNLAAALPALHAAPGDLAARSSALYGAWLCGSVLGSVGMSLHHKLCHTLGGSFNLPHAPTHTVVLPHALAYNAPYAGAAMQRIAKALGAANAAAAVQALARDNGGPLSLRELGMQACDLDRAAQIACANPYWNPRPIEYPAIRQLLQNAYDGAEPSEVSK